MNKLWNYNNVSIVHLEMSTLCNAACPACPRYYPGFMITKPGLIIDQISYDTFCNWFDSDFISRVNMWRFCGTQGDPMTARDIISIIEHIFKVNPKTQIVINTNGGLRNKKDWEILGNISSKYNLEIIFSIDGLQDTNHLYRRNVNWKVLSTNFISYISNGGNATWEFLIFKHNEHEISVAKEYSMSVGFKNFIAKKAFGFIENNVTKDIPVFDKHGNYEYSLFPPSDVDNKSFVETKIEFRNRDNRLEFYKKQVDVDIIEFQTKLISFVDYKTELDYDIKCIAENFPKSKYGKGSEIYVNVQGQIYPCCMIGTSIDAQDSNPEALQVHHRIRKLGKKNFNLQHKSIKEILDSNILSKLAENTWNTNNCLSFCQITCGSKNNIIEKLYDHKLYGKNDL